MQIYWGAVPFVVIQIIMVGADHLLPGHRLQRAGQGPTPAEAAQSADEEQKKLDELFNKK
jgi:hypothetical protein